jgi:hypothetical protein
VTVPTVQWHSWHLGIGQGHMTTMGRGIVSGVAEGAVGMRMRVGIGRAGVASCPDHLTLEQNP